MSAKLEEIEKRMAARKQASAAARAAQYEIDMEAYDGLQEEHGESSVKALHVKSYVKGLPTMVIVKSPGGTSYYKRFTDQIRAAKGNKPAEGAAQDMLARSSIVYPSDEKVLASMLDTFPNMLNDAALAAVEFVRLEGEEEKIIGARIDAARASPGVLGACLMAWRQGEDGVDAKVAAFATAELMLLIRGALIKK